MPDCCYSRGGNQTENKETEKGGSENKVWQFRFSENGGSSERIHNVKLVWDEFFDLNETYKGMPSIPFRNSFNGKKTLKDFISEFFFNVYYKYYKRKRHY